MVISQLFILIYSLERQLRCKHCLISLFLLLWDILHENQRSYGRRVNNFCREYSLAGTREISVKCPISWPIAYFGVVGATSFSYCLTACKKPKQGRIVVYTTCARVYELATTPNSVL